MMNVLCAVDGSPDSHVAIETLQGLGAGHGSTLELLYAMGGHCPLRSPKIGAARLWSMSHTDVGPIPRHLLTRAGRFFDTHADLTLLDKLLRGQVPERAMRPTLVVIPAPGFDDDLCVGQRRELVHIQTLIA
jgi:hypothetical protein